MANAIHRLQELRNHRARRARDLSIKPIVAATAADASRTFKKLGELIALWEQLVPAELARHTSLTGLRGGILHVVVNSSSTAFELDRLLRSGLVEQLRRQFHGTLVRVRCRIGKHDHSHNTKTANGYSIA